MRITKETLPRLKTDDPRGRRFYDSSVRGLGIKVLPNGTKTFELRYGGRKHRRRLTLGRFGDLTLDQARELAKDVLAQARRAALGQAMDPAEVRRRQKEMPTFSAWTTEYVKRIRGRLKSAKSIAWNLDRAVDAWGPRALDAVGRADVEALFQKIGKTGPTGANRWLAYTRSLFAEAVREGILSSNPAAGIGKMIEKPPRNRVLTDDEMKAFLGAVAQEEDVHARAGLYLLIETGARLSEVLRAKWEDLDLDSATWRIPSPKAGHPQAVPLSRSIVAKLKRLPRLGEYVVAGRDRRTQRFDLKGPWERALALAREAGKKSRAGAGFLENVTVHDLRRTFGYHVAKSAGLHVASKLLRHGDVRITEKVYAPLGIEELREAVEGHSEVLPFRKTESKRKRGAA